MMKDYFDFGNKIIQSKLLSQRKFKKDLRFELFLLFFFQNMLTSRLPYLVESSKNQCGDKILRYIFPYIF